MIPYGRHHVDEADIAAVADVLRHGALTQGPQVAAFEEAVAARVGARHAVAVSCGTAALHLACLAAKVGPGDTVITSPVTFVASANCALYVGARPDFADIDPTTLNLAPAALEAYLARNPRVAAVIPVHFGGLPCDMPAIAAAARAHGAVVIEDASHALGATYGDGSPVGNCRYADMTVFSFHPVKLIAAGEGGMITTNDAALYRRLLRLRSHGIVRAAEEFVDPAAARDADGVKPWYYEMQELGYNYRITDIQCALARSQLGKLDRFLGRRREIAARYDAAFAALPRLRLPQAAARGASANHLYVLRADFGTGTRGAAMRALADRGVGSQVHYIPVYRHPLYRALHFDAGAYPAAEAYYREALTIPLYYGMADGDVSQVIDSVVAVFGGGQ